MDDPNVTMEEYIRLEEEKAQRHGRTFNWQTATFGKVENYEDEEDCFIDFEIEFPAIVFDNTLTSNTALPCAPTILTRDMAPLPHRDLRYLWLRYQVDGYDDGIDLAVRLRMVYTGGEGQQVFVSHAWRRLFEIRVPLVREFILEFLSTFRMSDTEIGLDVADTLCFQLGGVRRKMTWKQFILALGSHTKHKMA
ncbi:hypothetical protein Tco_1116081 [Tanacetum coccineum]